jgi:hypothetical protein
MNWKKLGLIVGPDPALYWMSHGAGPSFASFNQNDNLDIYLTGRDENNRSSIGKVVLDINTGIIIEKSADPLFKLGELGTFDFNGASYPWIVNTGEEIRMYYTGWTRGFHVSFINDLGLSIQKKEGTEFHRISRAPLIPRTNEEPFGIGSVCVMKDETDWKMWYTCFKKWGNEAEPSKHFYHIKFAHSSDGIIWSRPDIVAIDYNENNGEFVTGKPCVIKHRGFYLMWFSYRGESYRMGFAVSKDGIRWKRMDEETGITVSDSGWDSEMICYGQIFKRANDLFMVYNGNGYGRSGLGLATMPVAELDEFIEKISG